MSEKVEVNVEEIRRVFAFLEEANDLFHQPMKYENSDVVKKFSKEHYGEIKELYYDVVWNWLPEKIKHEIEER